MNLDSLTIMVECFRDDELKLQDAELAARIRELEAENAVLKKVIEIDECGRGAIEARDKEIARKDAALGAAEELLAEIAAKYNGGHMYITHTIGQGAERIVAEIRALKEEKA